MRVWVFVGVAGVVPSWVCGVVAELCAVLFKFRVWICVQAMSVCVGSKAVGMYNQMVALNELEVLILVVILGDWKVFNDVVVVGRTATSLLLKVVTTLTAIVIVEDQASGCMYVVTRLC